MGKNVQFNQSWVLWEAARIRQNRPEHLVEHCPEHSKNMFRNKFEMFRAMFRSLFRAKALILLGFYVVGTLEHSFPINYKYRGLESIYTLYTL